MSVAMTSGQKELPPVDFDTFVDWVENYLLRTNGRHYQGDPRQFVQHVLHINHALHRGGVNELTDKLAELRHSRLYAEVAGSVLNIRARGVDVRQ